MSKKQLISNLIEEYRENYKIKTNQYPVAVPLTKKEFDDMVFIIRKFISEHPEQESYYYLESEGDDEPVISWRGSDLYISNEALKQRNSIAL